MFFVNKKSRLEGRPGFFLAVIREGWFVILEAFDTWLHPEVTFECFKERVLKLNGGIQFSGGRETSYTTYFGNQVHFVIWQGRQFDNHMLGSKILRIQYGAGATEDTGVDAGNYRDQTQFLNGMILRSPKMEERRS